MPNNRKTVNKGKANAGNRNTDTQKKNLRQNKIKVNIEHSKEAKTKAHSIVLSLIETGVTEEDLKNKIPFINHENYEDVVYERAITGICGYPLCNSVITHMFGDQTYIIRQNKVYNITQRRNYCSSVCYEASELVLTQVPAVPLYLRATDKDIQKYKLVVPNASTLKGRYGEFVNIRGTEYDWEEDMLKQEAKTTKKKTTGSPKSEANVSERDETKPDSSTSISNDSSINLSSMEGDVSMKTGCSSTPSSSNPSASTSTTFRDSSQMSIDSDAYLSEEGSKLSLNDKFEGEDEDEEDSSKRLPLRSDVPVLRSDGKNTGASTLGGFSSSKDTDGQFTQRNPALQSIYEVERALREWMTFESLRKVLGDNYVRGMLEELGKTWEDYDTTAGLRLGMEGKSKYVSLCKRLDAEERRENVSEARSCLDEKEGGDAPPSNPVPDYEQLKMDAQNCALNVKAFYEGRDELVEAVESLATIPEEEETGVGMKGEGARERERRRRKKEKEKEKAEREEEERGEGSLPLIDTYAQNTWRRQILFERLSRAMSSRVLEIGLDEAEVRRLVVGLIATLDLSPHNITLQMRQWDLVALVFLKMLSVRYPVIEETMSPGGRGYDAITAYLESAGLDPHYLSRLLSYLTEISYILTKYHKDGVKDHVLTKDQHQESVEGNLKLRDGSQPPMEREVEETVRGSAPQSETPDLPPVVQPLEEEGADAGGGRGRVSTNLEELD